MTTILKVKDLQKALGIGRERAYALMRSPGFPSTKLGKTYFVTEENLRDWLQKSAYKQYIL